MNSLQPIVVWSLEGALLRRDNSHAHLLSAAHAWMGRGDARFDAPACDLPPFREHTDNEVVRSVFFRCGIEAQDWMIQGALAYHERSLSTYLKNAESLATPGIERALTNLFNDGVQQLAISWHTERAAHIKLSSARIGKYFEVLRCALPDASDKERLDSGGDAGIGRHDLDQGDEAPSFPISYSLGRTGLSGIFSGDRGSLEGVLHALKTWASEAQLVLITASPREIFQAARLGFHCIGVTSGGVPSTELSMAGAVMVITERTGLEKIHKILPSISSTRLTAAQKASGVPTLFAFDDSPDSHQSGLKLIREPSHQNMHSDIRRSLRYANEIEATHIRTIDVSRAGRE